MKFDLLLRNNKDNIVRKHKIGIRMKFANDSSDVKAVR